MATTSAMGPIIPRLGLVLASNSTRAVGGPVGSACSAGTRTVDARPIARVNVRHVGGRCSGTISLTCNAFLGEFLGFNLYRAIRHCDGVGERYPS